MPAEADRLHAHEVAGRHPRVAQARRWPGPAPEAVDEGLLLAGVEPSREVDDTGQRLGSGPVIRKGEQCGHRLRRRREDGRHPGDAAPGAVAACRGGGPHGGGTSGVLDP